MARFEAEVDDPALLIERHAAQALAAGLAPDPFALLGPHATQIGSGEDVVVRTYVPPAEAVEAIDAGGAVQAHLSAVQTPGLFCGRIPVGAGYRLRIHWPGGVVQETEDPYSFGLLLSELDLRLFAEGKHLELGRWLGAQAMNIGHIAGVRFAVWAPNARRMSVVGDFNGWDGRRHPMRKRVEAGVWELFIPRLPIGALYKYEIVGPQGLLPLKADPVALEVETPPRTASIIADPAPFHWTDGSWLEARARQTHASHVPLSIYEVHAGSWRRLADEGWRSLRWGELGDQLIPYVTRLGFTHVELMPIMGHPFGGSWGYQVLSQFAPHAVHGSPADFARFVDRCHNAGLGVILDWVPGHFPTDAHGLATFDGSALYEHADPREGFHPEWNTAIYNLGRHEVRAFLLSSALHWIERYHVDGLRVDAVASLLYRDYARGQGQWIPNRYGGLGFSFKWNLGWMHDTLRYMSHDPVYRSYDHHDMTFGLLYAFFERFILPLSHDEVVHGKGSLIGRMPGDTWQRFANLRAYFGFMWTQPGKKLLFMGGEFGQDWEWNHDGELDWAALEHPLHGGVQRLVVDLNRLYTQEPALHVLDNDGAGFRWLVVDDYGNSVYAYSRSGGSGGATVVAVCNFTPVVRHHYRFGVPHGGVWREILNTDAEIYGGSNLGNAGWVDADMESSHGLPFSLDLTLPPLSTVLLRHDA